jgi:hypothetical protein
MPPDAALDWRRQLLNHDHRLADAAGCWQALHEANIITVLQCCAALVLLHIALIA